MSEPTRKPRRKLVAYDRTPNADRKAIQRQRATQAAEKAGFKTITELVNAILSGDVEIVRKTRHIS